MLLASLALLLGVVVYRIQTDEGELVITADEDAEISVKQGGKEVTVYDTKSKQKLVLNSGTYDLELKGKPTGLKLDIEKATLTRGDKKFARIERVVARPAAPAQGAAANAPVDSDNSGRERHSLLFPSSIGDGGAHNYRVEGQFLKIDTLTHSNQLWLNYNRCQASELELHCRLRITDVTDDAYFKLVLLSDYDSELSVLIRKRGTKHKLIIESVGSNNAFKILAERPIATDFARTWIDAIVILKGTKLQFFANGELLLEAKCDRVVNRYIALAALNCLVELSDPIVLVPKK